ncbi:MAG: Fe-S cluster assembly protein SufD [Acidobacteria bacterium]|nr:Fe-S cluster assembly protein SufD [Acidobacteriota bacterium]
MAEGLDPYLVEHERFVRGRGDVAPAWLKALRGQAREAFERHGFPTTRQEEWRFTNVSAIARTAFRLPEGTPTNPAPLVSRVAVPGAVRIVLLNGRFTPELSDLTTMPVGLKVGSLAAAIAQGAPECGVLGQQPTDTQAFAALNTAFLEDGALIVVRKGAVIEAPVHVIVIAGGAAKTMIHPRVLLVAGAGSQSNVAVSFLTAAGEAHFTNAVVEASLAEQAIVNCCLDQRGTEGSFLVTSLHVKADRDSSFKLRTITLGGRLVRNDATAVLAGEGAHVDLDGCYLADGSSLVDNHTTIDHAMPNCTSHELYKGILDGRAKAVFNGRIIVRLDAQKTDSKQTNRALLLSDEATINSNPQLEIFADDVKCTHGAAVGQLDEEAMFYLQARGLNRKDARDMLIHAYAGEVLERIAIPQLRMQLERELFKQLDRDLAEHDRAQ